MRTTSAIPSLIFIVIFGVGLSLAYFRLTAFEYPASMGIAAGSFVLAALASSATKIANQWEKAIVLRLGRFRSMKGPGLFFIIPIVDTVPYWIDIRVITSSFKASQPHCRRAKRPDKSSE